ncbi:hypothetical protein L2728_11460 [Shewanella chilikensis]|jgi:hypothetical protein|uniref:hypothetical protein n=1 Tax=Shewanella TaxID=22 RepID=UPI000F4226D0|nr:MULTISPECIES: hypothetical protein [Shewanella]AYV14355.1 hypothetical protein EEY24_16560 [Shewanella algae]MCL1162490.1 hypothetical protein [Shewanella chilikensis]
MKHQRPVFDIVTALRLRGMKVLSRKCKVIHIDRPTKEFEAMAVDIIENVKGIRRRSSAVQFHGVTVRWNEE